MSCFRDKKSARLAKLLTDSRTERVIDLRTLLAAVNRARLILSNALLFPSSSVISVFSVAKNA
jgi:hypothetical protein